jgi:hypothetical protein
LIIVDDTDASIGDFFEIGDVKLERGSTCTDYVNKKYQEELADCQRLFVAFKEDGVTWGAFGMGACGGTTSAWVSVGLPVEMRAVPTFSYENLANFRLWIGSSTLAITALGNNYGTRKTAILSCTVASGLTAGSAVMLSVNAASAASLFFSAEL